MSNSAGALQIEQDLVLQRRLWRVQRVGWVLIWLFLAAAVLGVFASGPLSSSTTTTAGGDLEVGFDRFGRLGATQQLDLLLHGGDGNTNVAISREFLSDYRLESLNPQPESVTAMPDRFVYTFDQSSPSLVRLVLQPREIGLHRARIWSPRGEPVTFTQLVYP